MQISNIARIGAIAFVALVLTATALEMRAAPVRPSPDAAAAPVANEVDPLRAALSRCQGLGMAAAQDGDCLRAWAENRRRFLAPGARPQAAIGRAPQDDVAVAADGSAHSMEQR